MSTIILHLSGPTGAGKSDFARLLATCIPADRFYHVRFDIHSGEAPTNLRFVSGDTGRAANLHCYIKPDTVFESFSDILPTIADPRESALVIVETGCHPCFRHAYPYDAKVFLMPPPSTISEVFRSPDETAGAVERAMHDTAEFAAELFGLERVGPQDSAWFPTFEAADLQEDLSIEDFLHTPVGIEISSRLQLRPAYQGIVDSDVVYLNNAVKVMMTCAEECAARIEQLLEPLRRQLDRRTWFAACDPTDRNDEMADRGIRRIGELLATAKTSHA